ncbi:MAG: hypothetical protein RL708_1369 [Bacteroidota bacterium]|jgi:hypothetical protein
MPEFKALLDSPTVYRTQIYFSKIKRYKNGKVSFTDYHLKKHKLYYYPASCVKLPVIIQALKEIKNQNDNTNDTYSPLRGNKISLTKTKLFVIDSNYCGFKNQSEIKNDWTFGEYIKRMLVVSNNICFNPIYDYVGTASLNHYFNSNIQQRFNYACSPILNKPFNRIRIHDSLIDFSNLNFDYNSYTLDSSWATAGLRYLDAKDSLINHPKSFAKSNYISLENLQKLFKNIVADKIDIRKEDRNFLLKYMSIYPSECRHPAYDAKEYPDNWGKYLLIGDDTNFHKSPVHQLQSLSIGEGKGEVAKEKLMQWADDSIRIFNKVGMAYGFLTDCAYIVDYKNQVEFIVSASVFVDRDGTLNDGKYAYKEIGLPFLGKLGRVLMQHELHHKRKSKFAAPKMEYTD